MRNYTIAHIAWEGDGITALYEGDDLIVYGDYYHNKINEYIDGFFFALGCYDIKYNKEDIYISEDDFDVTYGPELPHLLSILKKSYKWSKR